MMLNRRGVRDSASTQTRSVSRAQFQSAMFNHPRSPANRLTKSSLKFDYNQFQNTSSDRRRHSDDVVLPPVHRSPVKTPSSSGRRVVKQGPRKLPNVQTDPELRRIAWYHEDGSLNLQALLDLANKHSFPRTQSYYDRLEKLKLQGWPSPEVTSSPRRDDQRLIPLRFVDDDLTPRTRAERDSLLSLLLSSDDLTEHELEQIMRYIPDEAEMASTPRSQSCLRKSPRPQSGKKNKRSSRQSPGSSKSKTVHFRHTSTSTRTYEQSQSPRPPSLSGSPRPHSAPSPRTQFSSNPISGGRKFSDPFHVASPPPVLSPRALGSPDAETAYFRGMESPPEVPASPELIPEPKITYYDESGEEIEEEIQTQHQGNEGRKVEGRATPCEDDAASCPDESPPSDSSRPPLSPVPEADSPDHLPELDTPRVNRDPVDVQKSQTSQSHPMDSTPHHQDHSMSESSVSPRQIISPRPVSLNEDDPDKKQSTDSAPKDPDVPSPPKEDTPYIPENSEITSPTRETPRPESAPAEERSSHRRRKSHHKSSNRPKSSRADSRSTERAQKSPSRDHRNEKNAQKPRKHQDASPAVRPPPERSEPAREEPYPIPVFSVTRGQLSAIPPYSPRIQAPDSPALEPQPKDLTDTVQGQHSPRSSSLQDPESFSESPRGGKGRDHRMKIWLTRTAWNRDVECPD